MLTCLHTLATQAQPCGPPLQEKNLLLETTDCQPGRLENRRTKGALEIRPPGTLSHFQGSEVASPQQVVQMQSDPSSALHTLLNQGYHLGPLEPPHSLG